MTAPPPKVVVTLPARRVDDAVRQVAWAQDAGADAAELRCDRLAAGELARLGRLFPSELALLATYRSRAEGGEGEDDPAARRRVLLELASHPFRWIDLELARDRELPPELPSPERLGRIFSCHLRSSADEAWRGPLRQLETVEGVGKLVVEAGLRAALEGLAPEAARVGENVVVLTTGASGPLLRAWARRFGYPLVYAALPDRPGTEKVEPSQLAVDRLRRFLHAEEPPPLFALLGRPVAHSASPAVHERWIAEDGERGLYLPLEIADDREFVDALAPLAAGGFRGVNVTHPFKAVAQESADELGRAAQACGAANCLTFRGDEVLAENTDLLAMLRRLGELRDAGRWDGEELAVVGAGGAARATLAAARTLRASATVYARRATEARLLATEFDARDGSAAGARPHRLVVHATDVGREPTSRLDVPLAPLLAGGGHVLDWVYAPTTSELRASARAASATYEDGRRLLVYQAAATYEIWWGHPPPEASVAALAAEAA